MSEQNLHRAARQGDLPTIRVAVIAGSNVDELDDSGLTPLQWAIVKKQVDAALLLLEFGADVAVQGRDGTTALHCAIQQKQYAVLDAILKRRAVAVAIADKHGNQPLWTAAFNARGDYSMVKMLLEAGADPNHRNRVGLTPLDIPKQLNDPELLRLLESRTMRAE